MSDDVTDRLARFLCRDCGRDWMQYTHQGKEAPCIRCGSENIVERDLQSSDDTDRSGLYEKYEVQKDGEPVEKCFVLEPESDPAAREALWAYIAETDDEELEHDLKMWLLNTVGQEEGGDS